MRKRYDIRMNPRPLTQGDIDKHKDFHALLKKHQSIAKEPTPVYRRMSFWMVAAAAVAAMLVLYVGVSNLQSNQYEKRMADYFNQQSFIAPPFSDIQKSFASFRVDAHKGGVFEYPSGSKLFVPAAAFSDSTGNPVGGEVTIKYREMHDFVDFFMAGIPMSYDSAGVNYTLESAGMIEIFAEQDGRKVNMAPGKSINVELVSRVNVSPSVNVPPGYNIYRLDEQKRNWVYQAVDNMQLVDEQMPSQMPAEEDPAYPVLQEWQTAIQTIELNEANELAKLEASLPLPNLPVRPVEANPEEYVFDLDFNILKNPAATGEQATAQGELENLYKKYERMLWQLSPDAGISPTQLQDGFSNVSDIRIRKLNNNKYELTLKKGAEELTVRVIPVLSGNDLAKAKAAFNQQMERWQKDIEQREAALKSQKEELRRKYEEEKRLAEQRFKAKLDDLRKNGMEYAAIDEVIRKKVVNRFNATGFGIWNCDRPVPPNRMIISASFKSENGESYKNKTAYLVDKSRNTVYQFLAEDGARLNIDLNAQNLLWLVTDDQKIAVIRPEDFKTITKAVKEHDFIMQKIDTEIKSEEDVRKVLYL